MRSTYPPSSNLIFSWSIVTILCLNLNNLWVNFPLLSWFGHLIFSSFQWKIWNLLILCLFPILTLPLWTFLLISREVGDFFLVSSLLLFWQLMLFTSNSLLTSIFLIELLSTLIFLLLISSSFSLISSPSLHQSHIFSNFHPTLANPLLQAIIFFFWISFLLSILLFIVLIFFFTSFNSSDWFVVEFIFTHLLLSTTIQGQLPLILLWTLLLIGLFLKCGLAPFYFWKPFFFKNIPSWYLFLYITSFYFSLLAFLLFFFQFLITDLFETFSFITLGILSFGFALLIPLLWDVTYINFFFAVSSILNTLLIVLLLSSSFLSMHVMC